MAKKGKKPGEAQAARQRHINRQMNSDALKKLQSGETAQVLAFTSGGFKLIFVMPPQHEYDSWGNCCDPSDSIIEGRHGLVRIGNRLCVCEIVPRSDNDNRYRAISSGSERIITAEEILGWVNL